MNHLFKRAICVFTCTEVKTLKNMCAVTQCVQCFKNCGLLQRAVEAREAEACRFMITSLKTHLADVQQSATIAHQALAQAQADAVQAAKEVH